MNIKQLNPLIYHRIQRTESSLKLSISDSWEMENRRVCLKEEKQEKEKKRVKRRLSFAHESISKSFHLPILEFHCIFSFVFMFCFVLRCCFLFDSVFYLFLCLFVCFFFFLNFYLFSISKDRSLFSWLCSSSSLRKYQIWRLKLKWVPMLAQLEGVSSQRHSRF